MKLTGSGIDYLNIGLMLLACGVAYVVPFEVFLFSYAILGPLHYLTEISWLDKRNYFIQSKRDVIVFALATLLLLIGILDSKSNINEFSTGIFFTGFLFALVILFVKKNS